MSTTPSTPTLVKQQFSWTSLLSILTIVAGVLGTALPGGAAADAALAAAFLRIAQAAANGYQAQTGQPLDLNNIPPETPVP